MKRIIVLLLTMLLVVPAAAFALNAYGVNLEPSVMINGQNLQLNGFGLRSKWFVKVYIGSLYLTKQTRSGGDVISDQGEKLIRLNFLYSRVAKDKITEAIEEGFSRNAPAFARSSEAQNFHDLFRNDFVKGDVLDVVFGSDGSVAMKHNGHLLGSIVSKQLQVALLKTFVGLYPADEMLRAGMLGKI